VNGRNLCSTGEKQVKDTEPPYWIPVFIETKACNKEAKEFYYGIDGKIVGHFFGGMVSEISVAPIS